MNFLIVDDNRLIIRFLCQYIQGKGHTASALSKTSDVMDWLAQNPCDGIIVDDQISEPNDGVELTKEIRKVYPILPVVMFSCAGYHEDVMRQAKSAGINGYVSKGLGPSVVYQALLEYAYPAAG